MTDDDKALVERLRGGVLYGDARLHNPKGHEPFRMEAADRIEALSAEVERLNSIVADRLLGSSVDHRTFKDVLAENERLREALAATVDIWNRSKYSGDFEYWLTGHVRAALGETK